MEEQVRSPVSPDLDEIQRKIQETQERKVKLLQEKKKNQILRFSFDAQEKIRKIQKKQEQEEYKRLQDMAEKLERVTKT